uniref:Uncharacterized protein n=1 Tax=Arundo donax TaxID=35708 RepID=A0A0A9GUP7_ARUDO
MWCVLWQPWPLPMQVGNEGNGALMRPIPWPSFSFSCCQVGARSNQQWLALAVPIHGKQKLSTWLLPRRTDAIQLYCKGKGFKFRLLLSSGPHKLLMCLKVLAWAIYINIMKEGYCHLVEQWKVSLTRAVLLFWVSARSKFEARIANQRVQKGIVPGYSSADSYCSLVGLDCSKKNITWNCCVQQVLDLIMPKGQMVAVNDISLRQLANDGSAFLILLTLSLSSAFHGAGLLNPWPPPEYMRCIASMFSVIISGTPVALHVAIYLVNRLADHTKDKQWDILIQLGIISCNKLQDYLKLRDEDGDSSMENLQTVRSLCFWMFTVTVFGILIVWHFLIHDDHESELQVRSEAGFQESTDVRCSAMETIYTVLGLKCCNISAAVHESCTWWCAVGQGLKISWDLNGCCLNATLTRISNGCEIEAGYRAAAWG